MGRLKPKVTIRDAQDEMNSIAARLTDAYHAPAKVNDFPGFAVNVVPLLDQITGKKLQLALWILDRRWARGGSVPLINQAPPGDSAPC